MKNNRKPGYYIFFAIMIALGIAMLIIANVGCSASVECAEEPQPNREKTVRLYIDDSTGLFSFISGTVTAEFSDGTVLYDIPIAANRINQKYLPEDAEFRGARIENAKYDNGALIATGICFICFGGILIVSRLVNRSKEK